jgi:hypothetical protein
VSKSQKVRFLGKSQKVKKSKSIGSLKIYSKNQKDLQNKIVSKSQNFIKILYIIRLTQYSLNNFFQKTHYLMEFLIFQPYKFHKKEAKKKTSRLNPTGYPPTYRINLYS